MGLGASQARLLTITSRISDLELQANVFSDNKMRLSSSSAQASRNYTDALAKQKLTIYNANTDTYVDANANRLTKYNGDDTNRFLKNSYGSVIVSKETVEKFKKSSTASDFVKLMGYVKTDADQDQNNSYTVDSSAATYYETLFSNMAHSYSMESDDNLNSSDWLHTQLKNGCAYIEEDKKGNGKYNRIDYASGDNELSEENDDSGVAKAKAEYDTTIAEIKIKDDFYDRRIVQLQTEHSALENEKDSLKKVIEGNIGRSFKMFTG